MAPPAKRRRLPTVTVRLEDARQPPPNSDDDDDVQLLVELPPRRRIPRAGEVRVDRDISRGKERVPVEAWSYDVNDRPALGKYTPKLLWEAARRLPGGAIAPRGAAHPCCDCSADCSWESGCACVRAARLHDVYATSSAEGALPLRVPGPDERVEYDRWGRLRVRCSRAQPNSPVVDHARLIWECGERCACRRPACRNRVAQRGLAARLQLFRTAHCGWGVRTAQRIAKGAFVCEYAGELIASNDESEDDTYIFDCSSSFDVDARGTANVGRYVNHSCGHNVFTVHAMWDHGDMRAPHTCFYALRDIAQGDELTIDYGENWWRPKSLADGRMRCVCGTACCKYSGPDWERRLAEHVPLDNVVAEEHYEANRCLQRMKQRYA